MVLDVSFPRLVDLDEATYMDSLVPCVQSADVQAAQTDYLGIKPDVTEVGHTHTSM